jgi:hypothetical protein
MLFPDFHEPDEEGDGGEKEEEGGERQVARPHHVQRFPVRAQRESQRGDRTRRLCISHFKGTVSRAGLSF